jgi:hypothetical protein
MRMIAFDRGVRQVAVRSRPEKTPYCGHSVKYLESWRQDDVIKNQDVVIRKVGFEVTCHEESGVFWGTSDAILLVRTIDAWRLWLEVSITGG